MRTLALLTLALAALGCGSTSTATPTTPEGSAAPAEPAAPSAAPAASAAPSAASAAPSSAASAAPSSAPSASASAGKPASGVNVAGLSQDALSNGKFSQEDIRKILEANGEIFGDCYTLGAGGKNKSFTGMVKVKATIGPGGDVKTVEVLKSDTKNKKVDACVSDAFRKIKFPAPKNGATSVVTFPISFGPLEEVK